MFLGCRIANGGAAAAEVFGEMAECGYHSEWDCISAPSVGALHRRDRIFIVAIAIDYWITPTAGDAKNRQYQYAHGDRTKRVATLVGQVRGMFPTPRARDGNCGPPGSPSSIHNAEGDYLDGVVQETSQESGRLNPEWVEWLMGFPIGWTALEPSETQLSHRSEK